MKLSIVVPVFNESRTIGEILERLQNVDYGMPYEIIVVNDASQDKTPDKSLALRSRARDQGCELRLFHNRINRGKGYSVRKGIRRSRGNILIIQDADTEYDPADIPQLLKPIVEGRADVVFGSRFRNTSYPKGMAFPNYIANRFLTLAANILYGFKLTDIYTCYKAVKMDFLRDVRWHSDRFALDAELAGYLARRKCRFMELPIQYFARSVKEGKKIKASDFFKVLAVFFFCAFVPMNYWKREKHHPDV